MMNNWRKVKLGDICIFSTGKSANTLTGNIPIYGGNGIMGYTDNNNNENCVIIGRVGAYCGSIFYEKNKCWMTDNAITFMTKENIKFMFYLLKTLNLPKRKIGTSQPLITQSILKNIEISLPPLEEQKAIAGVLSSFDDKIELNNKIIKNLEEQAQTLYKHWFVDFEFPNENGQPYKSSGGTFKDSELGKIPTDWEVSLLKKFLLFQKGFEPGNKTYLENQNLDNIPFYRVGELLSNPKIFINKNLNPNVCIANIKDVLVSFDGTVGRVSIAKRGAFSSGIRKIVSKVNSINNAFIYVLFKSDYIQNEMKKYESNRTTITHASGAINDFLIAYSSNIYLKFSIIIDPLYNELIQLKLENEKLAEMRDYLLPKLMSGKIRVKVD